MTKNGLKTVHIASMLGVSERTVRRHLSEFGIDSTGTFSDIDDLTLDTTIRSLQVQFPNSGYRMMLGHLRARGLKIQQTRVRESMHATHRPLWNCIALVSNYREEVVQCC